MPGNAAREKPVCLQSSATPPHLPQTGLPVARLVEGVFRAVAPSGHKQEFLDYLDQCGLWPNLYIYIRENILYIKGKIINSCSREIEMFLMLLGMYRHLVEERGITEKLCDYFNGPIIKSL